MSDTLELLSLIFGERRGFVGTFSGLRHGVRSKKLDATRSAYFCWSDERHQVENWFRNEDEQGREVYFCAHLLKARRRIKANAAPLLALYVDGDGAKISHDIPPPTAVIESSPGREQYYWRLRQPVAPEGGERLNRRLALAMGADRSGWDLTQLLRPPGMRNNKYQDTPLVVLREATDVSYEPDELDRLLPPLPRKHPPEARLTRRPKNVGSSPDLSRLSRRMRDLIRHGNNGEYESRSESDFAACLAMFGAGYAEAEVWAAMTGPTNGISEKFFEKGRGGERYLSLTIGKAKAIAQASSHVRRGRVYTRRKGAVSVG